MTDSRFRDNADHVLIEMEQELLQRMSAARKNEAPAMNSAVGRLSFIDAFQQHQMDLHAERKMSVQLASIRAALERLRVGNYGVCTKCGGSVPDERLECLPDTPYCTRCTS